MKLRTRSLKSYVELEKVLVNLSFEITEDVMDQVIEEVYKLFPKTQVDTVVSKDAFDVTNANLKWHRGKLKAARESNKKLSEALENIVGFIGTYGIHDKNGRSLLEDIDLTEAEEALKTKA